MEFREFSSALELNSAFALEIKEQLAKAIEQRGHAVLGVSGGKTPLPLFQALCDLNLAWEHVTVALVDDRWLDETHPDSNEGLVKAHLLQKKAKSARFVSLVNQDSLEDAFAGLSVVQERFVDIAPFDVAILGMGEDGHTASLFPCSAQISEGLADTAPSLLVVEPQTAPYQRVTFSKAHLLLSKQLYVHLVGEKKRAVLAQAQAGDSPLDMPIRAFLQQTNVPLTVFFTANA